MSTIFCVNLVAVVMTNFKVIERASKATSRPQLS